MCVHVHSSVCVCVCVVCVYARMGVRLGISFAKLIKLIMDPVFSLCYVPDLPDKNSVLPDMVEVFQSRKANIPGHHN